MAEEVCLFGEDYGEETEIVDFNDFNRDKLRKILGESAFNRGLELRRLYWQKPRTQRINDKAKSEAQRLFFKKHKLPYTRKKTYPLYYHISFRRREWQKFLFNWGLLVYGKPSYVHKPISAKYAAISDLCEESHRRKVEQKLEKFKDKPISSNVIFDNADEVKPEWLMERDD